MSEPLVELHGLRFWGSEFDVPGNLSNLSAKYIQNNILQRKRFVSSFGRYVNRPLPRSFGSGICLGCSDYPGRHEIGRRIFDQGLPERPEAFAAQKSTSIQVGLVPKPYLGG